MFPYNRPLIAFFLGLYLQLFVPSQTGREVTGIDFGEPTRNCLGRGQICRIDRLDARWESPPEALGETWTDSLRRFHLSIREGMWDGGGDSLNNRLWVPEDDRQWKRGSYHGSRDSGRIQFLLIPQNQ